MPGDATGSLAEFVSATRFDRLEPAVVEYVKRLILDGVANAVAGSRTEPARIQQRLADNLGSGQVARVLGTGEHRRHCEPGPRRGCHDGPAELICLAVLGQKPGDEQPAA
jgi:MmgE/PrpD N-terminal domain